MKVLFILIQIIVLLIYTDFSVCANEEVFAHYLPWFQSKYDDPNDSTWGVTWTRNGHNPYDIDQNTGQRDICAVDYPLIGPYDSNDLKTLEYHVLLAQSCGIKGFVVDLFGTNVYEDDQRMKQGFEELATNVLPYLNLLNNNTIYSDFKVCIAYDEQGVKDRGPTCRAAASNDLCYFRDNYLLDTYYTNQDTLKPFLMIWNYHTSISKTEWYDLLKSFTNVFTIDYREYPEDGDLNSHYPWVQDDSWPPNPGPIDPNAWGDSYLTDFYQKSKTNSSLLFTTGGVWPGFNESGWKSTNVRIMNRQGLSVYQNTWNKIHNDYPTYPAGTADLPLKLVQIITWNDWGEGTEIEPSVEYGYDYIAETRKQINNFLPPVPTDDLALLIPQIIYNARLAVNQSISGVDNSRITNAITDFYNSNYYSALTNATRGMGASIPQIHSIERGNGTLKISYTKVANAQGYKIYIGVSSNYLNLNKNFTIKTIASSNTTNAVVTGLKNSLDYYCAVSAYMGEKYKEDRYKIETGVSYPFIKVLGDGISPSSLHNFKAEKYNNQIRLSWTTPQDSDYHSSTICYMASSRYPQTPHEGTKIIQITNAPGTYAEYTYTISKGGYKYFSAFALDKVENYSTPLYANLFIVDKSVKLAGNLINPSLGQKQTCIYIDTDQKGKRVKVKIYNLKGKLIKSFPERVLNLGRNQYVWPENDSELNDIPSGVYILSVTGDIEQTEKIVVVK